MTSGWARLVRSNWVKLALVALCVLVSVTLYMQYNHFNQEIIFPHVTKKISFTIGSANTTKRDSDHNASFMSQYSEFNYSSGLSTGEKLSTTTERPFLREPVINPHEFNYVIKPNVTCSSDDVTLVMCVTTRYDNYNHRVAIRQTWGSYAFNTSNKARLVFFIGAIPPTSDKSAAFTQRNIIQESSQYGDILQEDYVDSYKNLSLKSVSMLKWVSLFCSATKFVLKVDDDMYINIPLLVQTLHEYSSNKFIPEAYVTGYVLTQSPPFRDNTSKWYTPLSAFSGDVYPDFVTGTAYVMPGTTASLLYQASLRVPLFWLEDVYITGLCAKQASVQVFNCNYFSNRKAGVSGCSFKSSISAHGYTSQEKLQIHQELNDPNLRC